MLVSSAFLFSVSKSIHVLRNHLVKCPKAPGGMAQTVNTLFDRHKEEKVSKTRSEHLPFCCIDGHY